MSINLLKLNGTWFLVVNNEAVGEVYDDMRHLLDEELARDFTVLGRLRDEVEVLRQQNTSLEKLFSEALQTPQRPARPSSADIAAALGAKPAEPTTEADPALPVPGLEELMNSPTVLDTPKSKKQAPPPRVCESRHPQQNNRAICTEPWDHVGPHVDEVLGVEWPSNRTHPPKAGPQPRRLKKPLPAMRGPMISGARARVLQVLQSVAPDALTMAEINTLGGHGSGTTILAQNRSLYIDIRRLHQAGYVELVGKRYENNDKGPKGSPMYLWRIAPNMDTPVLARDIKLVLKGGS